MSHTLLQRMLLGVSALIGLMTVITIAALPHHMNPDVGLYLEMGQKVLDGQRPYVDYEEINFPMIHWMNVLPAALSRLTGLAPTITFHLGMLVLILVVYGLLWRLFPRQRLTAATLILGLASVSWMLLIILQWGQREHIFTLLYLPFLALRARRREGVAIGVGMALTIGIMAGVGVAIKPYFALTAVLVELVGLVVSRRWFIRAPEIAGVGLVALLHLGYFALNPDVLQAFLTLIGRLSDGYGAYLAISQSEHIQVVIIHLTLAVLPLLFIKRLRQSNEISGNLYLMLSMMGIGSIIGFVLQGKGWFYHGIPFIAANLLLYLLLIARWMTGLNSLEVGFKHRLVLISGLGLAFGIIGYTYLGLPRLDNLVQIGQVNLLSPYVEAHSRVEGRIMIVDAVPNHTYPMLSALNRRNASRYAVAHPFPLAYFSYEGLPYTDPAHVVPDYILTYLDHFKQDMARHQPSLFIVRSTQCGICSPYASSLHDYLDARGVLAEVIDPNYDLLTIDNGFHIYVRKGITPNQ